MNETREMIVKMRENKEKEIKKMKERYDDERRRESEQFQIEYEKIKTEVAILNKRLGNEEQFSKELSIINNKLQNNNFRTVDMRAEDDKPRQVLANFYPQEEEESDSDELAQRRKAWAELEREQDEVKRTIKSMMKTQPESRIMDNPMLTKERVSNRYDNTKKNDWEDDFVRDTKKDNFLKEEKKSPKKDAPKKQPKPVEQKKDTTPKKKGAEEEKKFSSFQAKPAFEEIKPTPVPLATSAKPAQQ